MTDFCDVTSPRDVVRVVLDGRPSDAPLPRAEAYAPANIALCKYWGKRDERLNLPVTSSLSLSLGRLGSQVTLALHDGPEDRVELNGELQPADGGFARRVSQFMDLFRGDAGTPRLRVQAVNTIPTAAGFASSASGFAALTKALDALFGWHLTGRALSILARLGSGSACRSVFDGLVEWQAGTARDGMDSYARPLGIAWPELRIGLVLVSAEEKGLSSRAAMQRTVATSPLYRAWPELVARDLAELKVALLARDFEGVGAVAERNALAMHATMLAAAPPVFYWRPGSVQVMQCVWACRAGGLPVYFTMDAGPNVKVLYLAGREPEVLAAFAGVTFVRP